MAIRAPLDILMGLTGGQPNLRGPLAFLGVLTGGNPTIRGSLAFINSLTGGNPKIRCPLVVVQALFPIPEELPVATLLFPALTSTYRKWDRTKAPTFNTGVREMTSGRVSALPFYQYPRWDFVLSYDYLPDAGHVPPAARDTILRQLAGLFQDCQGRAQPFLYHDVDDFHVVGGAIATADGVTLQWPFLAAIFGSVQPVGQIDLSVVGTWAPSAVAGNDIVIPNHCLKTGSPVVPTTTGALPGGLTSGNTYWAIVVDKNTLQLASSASNALAGMPITLTSIGSGTGTLTKTYVIYDNGTIVSPGSASLTLPNQAVWGVAPTSGHLLTADFDFYFVCRFKDDAAEFNQFMSTLHELKKLEFMSEPTG